MTGHSPRTHVVLLCAVMFFGVHGCAVDAHDIDPAAEPTEERAVDDGKLDGTPEPVLDRSLDDLALEAGLRVCGYTTCGGRDACSWTCYKTQYGCGRLLRGDVFVSCGQCIFSSSSGTCPD